MNQEDTTNLSYWLNWRVLLCSIWVFGPMIIALFIIKKHDRVNRYRSLSLRESWRPCLNQINPFWLMIFRLFSFFILLVTLVFKVYITGVRIYFYYTQWTFTLLTVFFGFGSVLSIYGCCNVTINESSTCRDTEQGLCQNNKPLIQGNNRNTEKEYSIWTRVFEILFQMNVGAVILTDGIYWFIIFPFLTIQDYSPSFLTIAMHSINVILLLCEAALNCLKVPFLRISFFILWTGFFVIFQWIVHACVSIWWPYPFLDLSSPYAPLWYLLVGVMHIPSYGLFVLILRIKHYFLAKWFPLNFHC